MSQTTEERIAAIASLLPLLESHLEHHGRTTARAQWISAYEPPPPGWQPPVPEPDCNGSCPSCTDFRTRRCTLHEERWAATWLNLRRRYPQLKNLEEWLDELMYVNARWASALYWVHVQPWDDWNRGKRAEWARLGVAWIEERFDGWVPTHVQRVAETTPKADKVAEAGRLRADGCSHDQIRRELHMSKKDVPALLSTFAKRNGIS